MNIERSLAVTFGFSVCSAHFVCALLHVFIEILEKTARGGGKIIFSQLICKAFFSCLSISILFATIYTIQLTEKRNEWKTMLLTGCSPIRRVKTLLFFSLLFSLFICILHFYIKPFLGEKEFGPKQSCFIQRKENKIFLTKNGKSIHAKISPSEIEVLSSPLPSPKDNNTRFISNFFIISEHLSLFLLPLLSFLSCFFLYERFPLKHWWPIPLGWFCVLRFCPRLIFLLLDK